MYSDFTIINLKLLAAVFMGYEYFVSESVRKLLDDWAERKAGEAKREAGIAVKARIKILRRNVLFYLSSLLAMLFLIAALLMAPIFLYPLEMDWLVLLVVLALSASFVFVLRSVWDRLIIKGLAPMIVPLMIRVVTTYLLLTPKKVIAGIGMLFLVASFWAEYSNLVHSK
jgi:hypothetical protein